MLLDDSYSLESFSHPGVVSHGFLFAESACSAAFVSYMVCASSASSAFYVNDFALAFAH